MGLALDEPRDNDEVVQAEGLKFVIDQADAPAMQGQGGIVVDHRSGWWGEALTVAPAYGGCG